MMLADSSRREASFSAFDRLFAAAPVQTLTFDRNTVELTNLLFCENSGMCEGDKDRALRVSDS